MASGSGETAIPIPVSETPEEREDLMAIRRIADRLPALRALAESLGAWHLTELFAQAERLALAHCEAMRSTEIH